MCITITNFKAKKAKKFEISKHKVTPSSDGDYCMSLQSKTAKESEPQIKQTIKPPLKCLHFTKGDYTMS